MLSEDRLYWVWLSQKCGAASKEFARLIARFENPFDIFRLDAEELYAIDCIGDALRDKLSEKSLEHAYSILKYCSQNAIDIISYGDKRYPLRLKTLEDPPVLLYCIGTFPKFDDRLCVGVVGTRKISAYGMQSTYKISYELASASACIVSGMALGVDAVAACAALEAGGTTVAVLGCGVDVVYPKTHARLKRAISKSGCIISEYPPAEAPYASNFPKRNRIISGLCQGVLVIEGNKQSGAMITAEKAISQGREVFALPGKINESNSEGPNDLIQKGVNVALSAYDIAIHFDLLYHGAVDFTSLYFAKRRSEFVPSALEKYGVSTEVYFGTLQNNGIEEKRAEHKSNTLSANSIVKDESVIVSRKTSETEDIRPAGGDNSLAVLDTLDSITKNVFEAMPIDKAVSPDEFVASGISISEAITSLTMLEIMGLVLSLPGGMYLRK